MPTALIAEDEPLLAQALQRELAQVWPELLVLAQVGDGRSAVREALRLKPDVLFLDIRMPGLDGLAAAEELADTWPENDGALPLLVFVTAYDEYAVRAFDAQAQDYVLKPVQTERLRRTTARLQQTLAARAPGPLDAAAMEPMLAQWRALLATAGAGLTAGANAAPSETALRFITASDAGGNTVKLVPIEEVLYFEAADKYVRVLTATQEHLIRTPLRQLLPQLDSQRFWQIHRGTVVRADAIEHVQRDESGRLHLLLKGRAKERLAVSRLYAHLFRAM